MRRFEWLNRLKAVEREFEFVRFAIEQTERLLGEADSDLPTHLSQDDARSAKRRLAATYLVRIFAEFEAALRDYWRSVRDKTTQRPVSTLIESLARYCAVSEAIYLDANDVRERRNRIVHDGELPTAVDIGLVRGQLCVFLSHLLRGWPA